MSESTKLCAFSAYNYYFDSTSFMGFITSASYIGCSKAMNNNKLYSIEVISKSLMYYKLNIYVNIELKALRLSSFPSEYSLLSDLESIVRMKRILHR